MTELTIEGKQRKRNRGCFIFLVILFILIIAFVIWLKNLNTYTLKPGESVKIEVKSLTNQADYSTDLTINNKNGAKLELGMIGDTSRYWIEYKGARNKYISYDTETQKVTSYNGDLEENKEKELENSPKRDAYLKGRRLIIQAKGEKTFDATGSAKYYITVKNLSSKTARFETTVISR